MNGPAPKDLNEAHMRGLEMDWGPPESELGAEPEGEEPPGQGDEDDPDPDPSAGEGMPDGRPPGEETAGEASIPDRHMIVVGTRTDLNEADALCALAIHPDVYDRAGLVRLVRSGEVHRLKPASLVPILSAVADFAKQKKDDDGEPVKDEDGEAVLVPIQPPRPLAESLIERGSFPGIRELVSVTRSPIVLPDGSMVSTPGYHRETKLLYAPIGPMPHLLERPSRDDAVRGARRLLSVVREFPLQTQADRSAWLALVLTLACRSAFDGNVPLIVASANQARVGKTRALQLAELIAHGLIAPTVAWPKDEEELRKRVDTFVAAGCAFVLWDNVRRAIVGEALEMALTSTLYRLRILGKTEERTVENRTVFGVAANGAVFDGDIAPRVLPMRQFLDEPHPERRTFDRPDIMQWVRERRLSLLSDAISIVRAYLLDNRPDMGLAAWGSFEPWSAVIRGSLVYAGLPDPIETREGIEQNDHNDAGHTRLVMLCLSLFRDRDWAVAELAGCVEADLHPESSLCDGWTVADARELFAELGVWDRASKTLDRFRFGRYVLPKHADRPALIERPDAKRPPVYRIARARTSKDTPKLTRNKAPMWHVVEVKHG